MTRPRRFQPSFSLSELVPEESERVFTQFSVAGLELLDSLPPVHLNTITGLNSGDEDVNTDIECVDYSFGLQSKLFILSDPKAIKTDPMRI